ncbi:hypothetical protein ACFQX6_63775 [Streptosporangium lutulentum]
MLDQDAKNVVTACTPRAANARWSRDGEPGGEQAGRRCTQAEWQRGEQRQVGRADVYERMRSWLLGSGATWARWTALRLLRLVDLWRARSAPEPSADKVRILLFHAYGMGGTIRTVLNLAGYLAHGHDVEIVSLIRAQHRPFFPIPPGVKVSFLDDRTERKGRTRALLSRLPSVLVPSTEPTYRRCSLWTDLVLLRYLRSLRGGVLITTRPSLNLFAASFAPPEVITIGQEHRNLAAHKPRSAKSSCAGTAGWTCW